MIICCNFLHQKIDKMATFFNLRMVFMLHLKRGKNVLIKFMYGIHIVIIKEIYQLGNDKMLTSQW